VAKKQNLVGFLKFFVLVVFVVLAGAALYIAKVWRSLPEPVLSTVTMADKKSKVIVYIGHLKPEDATASPRIPVSLSAVSPNMVKAIMAAEDRRYKEHHGIDSLGILRATLDNLKSWRFAEGASTISQQLAKNVYLDPNERNARRKLKQIILAWRLEDRYSKDQIMEAYLNEIYFGSGAYGIEAASRKYFHKHANELSIAQAAFLAGIVKAPSVLGDPDNREQAISRQHDVIDNMLDYGYIDQKEARIAAAEKLPKLWDVPKAATPGKPGAPSKPTAPSKPEAPLKPTTPSPPTAPSKPTTPLKPTAPAPPTTPLKPTAPAPATTPLKPTTSSKSADSVHAANAARTTET
jgi:penicillin-binding protein 1A